MEDILKLFGKAALVIASPLLLGLAVCVGSLVVAFALLGGIILFYLSPVIIIAMSIMKKQSPLKSIGDIMEFIFC